MIRSLHIRGYRSLRNLRLRAGRINVVVGPNGSGKSNLYRALTLLAHSVDGRLAATLAREGGMASALWAGSGATKRPPRVSFTVETEAFTYELAFGRRPSERGTLFKSDPEVKEERLTLPDEQRRSITALSRKGLQAGVLDRDGRRVSYPLPLDDAESALAQIQDPARYPETHYVRSLMRRWRFYHQFRLDEESAARRPGVTVKTPILADDGCDVACALGTIMEDGDSKALLELLKRAFPESDLLIDARDDQHLSLRFQRRGLERTLSAMELSDGTLKFLCLLAALLSTRPPGVLVLNEPENSLHPDLLDPLAELIARAGERSQVWIITHSAALAERIHARGGERPIRLELRGGETVAPELTVFGDRADDDDADDDEEDD